MNVRHFPARLAAVLLALACLVSLVSCRGGDDEEQVPDKMQCASREGDLFRLYVPSSWNLLQEAGQSGAYFSMTDKVTVTVHAYDNPDTLSADRYTKEVYLPSVEAGLGCQLQTEDGTPVGGTLGGVAATVVSYSAAWGENKIFVSDILAAWEGKIYVLSYRTGEETRDTYADIYAEIVKNFVFSDKPYPAKDPVNTVDPDAEAPEGMQLASNDDVAYRFYVPAQWTLDRRLPTSSAYVSESDRSNVSVTVYMPDSDHMTAEEYFDMVQTELKNTLQEVSDASVEETELDGRPARIYTYRANVGGDTYCFVQTVAAYRGMVYTITYTATPEHYEEHLAEYRAILSAFDFRGN